ncbi:LRR receptor-like serine/threonine-protein kinase EFR isoform X3 [Lycium ferocissimum]|uniref:LRR receptor-like serine/threonine-protein kinase EFR isoform X3 n=1 Tax=Lycium ferocissimum TaxID=112874 RepID=UPI002815034D|nr:LRR receptor-like serine/threonine-protein kinase EFR isoform X3 [Lycium ferocissimum]
MRKSYSSFQLLAFLLFVHVIATCLALNISTDQTSPLALKTQITSDPYQILSENWTSSTSVCNWIGITCGSRHQRVTVLNISDMGFSGTIPPQLGHLSFLVSLDLSYNNFHGELPPEFSRLRKLRVINLSFNNFTGQIPKFLGEFQDLQMLSLENNSFSGFIPSSISNMKNLGFLNLRYNNLEGNIPTGIATLRSLKWLSFGFNKLNGSNVLSMFNISTLEYLDLRNAGLIGDFPSDLCRRLPRLQRLGLNFNMLSGEIPRSILKCSELQVLLLLQNNFIGKIPRELGKLQLLQILTLGFNKLQGTIPDEIGDLHNLKQMGIEKNALIGSIPLTIFNISSLQVLSIWDNKLEGPLPREVGNLTMLNVLDLGINNLTGVIPDEVGNLQELLELKLDFNNFSGSIPIGSGSFGSVYKGTLEDGMIVAVKVFNVQLEGTFQTFDRECEILWNLHHRNLTKIISSCCNLDFKALVLEYMPNVSLDNLLYSQDYSINIMQQLNVMVDVASALEYLHHGYFVPIIHCDLKPSNVLLDKDMVGHLTDFGIAKLLTKEESIAHTATFATIGYIAPECGLEGLISKRSDVYSYGIMLLETFTKKKPNDEMFTGDVDLRSWVHSSLHDKVDEIIDADLLTIDEENLNEKLQYVSSIMELAMNCRAKSPVERMNMTDIVVALEKIKQQLSSQY